ncbi:MAG: mechanosensitive ion channel family protein [Chloroflexi bacterium]|nr:mechanosensitive ion channel family protein [Chloroflexota bacterium]
MPGSDTSAQVALALLFQQFLIFLPKLITALVLFTASLYASGWVGRGIRRSAQLRNTDPEIAQLLSRLGQWTVIIMGTLWALQTVNRNVTGFIAGLGIMGFTVGFALQDVAKNFIAGILLLLQQPFDVGDAIAVTGYSGKVLDVDIRATKLLTFDGLHVLIPNTDVYMNAITNYSRASARRIKLDVGVAYDSDLKQVTQTALEAIATLPGLKTDSEPQVVFHSFADSSINFTLYYWINLSDTGYFTAQDQGVKLIHLAFAAAGIDIPYPIRTVLQK